MDWDWSYFTKGIDVLPEIFASAVMVYAMVLLYTKLFGLKSFSKMTGFDFVNTLAIGGLLAMSVSTPSPAPIVGAFSIGMLYLFNAIITRLRFKSPAFAKAVQNKPILLMRNGNILHDNLKKTKITEDELRGKLREANALQLSQVKAVVLETTGDVSVLHSKEDTDLEDYLLEGVRA